MVTKRKWTFKEIAINESTFPKKAQIEFGFTATSIMIIIDDDVESIEFTLHSDKQIDGKIKGNCDGPLAWDGLAFNKIWFKGPDGKQVKIRIWAWAKG